VIAKATDNWQYSDMAAQIRNTVTDTVEIQTANPAFTTMATSIKASTGECDYDL